MGDDTVSTFAELDDTRSSTSVREQTHTSAEATNSRLSTMEPSVDGIQEEVLGLKASINGLALWLKQQGANPSPPKRPKEAHTKTLAGTTNSRFSAMATSVAGIQEEVLGLKVSINELVLWLN
jgi:hypothetical protein